LNQFLVLGENPFIVCGHLPDVQKHLETSKLKVRTLDDYCIKTRDFPEKYENLIKYFWNEYYEELNFWNPDPHAKFDNRGLFGQQGRYIYDDHKPVRLRQKKKRI
jgi:hypothetical protein